MSVVRKYGGRSLSRISDLTEIAERIEKEGIAGDGLVLVMASLEGLAENILNNAKTVNPDIPREELDALFSAGEVQTVALMAAALEARGIPARSVSDLKDVSMTELDARDSKQAINTDAVEQILAEGKVAVVAGFQGIGEYNAEEKAGRYGAAATAVAIAAQLGCDCHLCGDENAIYTMDQSLAPAAKPIETISYEEIMEMIQLGGTRLETRAIELAKIYDVTLHIGGTTIMNQNLIVESSPVTGVSVADDIVIYTLKGVSYEGGVVARVFDLLSQLSINVDMISQQQEGSDTCTLAFSCESTQIPALDEALAGCEDLKGVTISKQDGLSMISIVGVGMASHSGVASKVFNVLAEQNISHYQITTSEISITVTVDADRKGAAVVALGEAFNL